MTTTKTLLGCLLIIIAATSAHAADDVWNPPLFEATAVWQEDDTIEVLVDIYETNADGMATEFVASARLSIRDGGRARLKVRGVDRPVGFTVDAIKPTRSGSVLVVVTVSQDQRILSVESRSVYAAGKLAMLVEVPPRRA